MHVVVDAPRACDKVLHLTLHLHQDDNKNSRSLRANRAIQKQHRVSNLDQYSSNSGSQTKAQGNRRRTSATDQRHRWNRTQAGSGSSVCLNCMLQAPERRYLAQRRHGMPAWPERTSRQLRAQREREPGADADVPAVAGVGARHVENACRNDVEWLRDWRLGLQGEDWQSELDCADPTRGPSQGFVTSLQFMSRHACLGGKCTAVLSRTAHPSGVSG